MSLSKSGYPELSKSITNPNVKTMDALDDSGPFSFLKFIKNISNSFDPDKIQEYYNAYLKEWNYIKNNKEGDTDSIIIERYRDFIKDINVNYTTVEERKFLEQLDFNDPLDLDVAIPFYSRKLIEIANYYNKKREETKFQVIKNNTKGTIPTLEKEITNITLNFLENYDDNKILFDIDEIKTNIEVEIEELYETYPSYFNQSPDDSVYDYKDLDYGLDIFLKNDQDLISEVFANVSEDLKSLKESDQLFENKRKLTEKYISSDFYYLSTGSTVYEFISGKLFDSDKPIANFLNKNYPTTASTNRKSYTTEFEQGFFRPHKTSILLVDGRNSSFKINFENLQPNSIYYFQDPEISGDSGDVLTFINDDLFLKRNDSSGVAKNQPTSNRKDSKYYGYISQTEITPSKYLDKIFESGYIQDEKSDSYNNLYGLFINNGDFSQTIQKTAETEEYFQILNGHTFYDYLYGEDYLFDYTTFDDSTIPYTTRSGISSFTGEFTTDFYRFYNIFGGKFTQKDFSYPPNYLPSYQLLDGVFFLNNDIPYTDTISSDLSAYPDSGSFYYSRLIEGGIHTESPLQRALLDASYPTLTADLTQDIKPDETNTFSIDSGFYIRDIFPDISLENFGIYYDPTVFETSVYSLTSSETDNYFNRSELNGKLYVRNSYNKSVVPLEEALPYFSTTFELSTYTEIVSGVKKFEIVDDILCLETDNNFIITKVLFENGEFTDPKNTTFITKLNNTPFQKISNRFKHGNSIYYALVNIDEYPATTNNFKIYPTIYELNVDEYTRNIHTPNISNDFYMISGGDISYNRSESPILTYDIRNNIFSVSFLLKDSSNNFIVQEFDFEMNPFNVLTHRQYKQ